MNPINEGCGASEEPGTLHGTQISEHAHFMSKWHPTTNLAIKYVPKISKN